MKRIKTAMMAASMMLLAFTAVAAANLSFATVIDNLDLRKNTKLHVREYWKSIQDQQVTWAGNVYDVQGGAKSRVKIYIADKSRPLYKGYNIVVSTHDVEKAANLKKGQRVKFSGALRDFSSKRAGAVIEISDAQLL